MNVQLNCTLQASAACSRPVGRRAVAARCTLPNAVTEVDRPSIAPSTAAGDTAAATLLEKNTWQSSVRTLQGRRKHRLWEPVLTDPPPLLGDVCVVLVSPKRPISVGTVARSLSCFECDDLRIVQPRCDHLARSARNGSKGAQFLLWRAAEHDSLASALADVDVAVACTRWVAGRPNAFRGVSELLAHPQVAELLAAAPGNGSGRDSRSSSSLSSSGGSSVGSARLSGEPEHQQGQQPGQQLEPGPQRRKLALVFGREVEGLLPEEVDACDATLSIPIGRLQESMSLSHAVSVVLSRLFELRQQASGYELPQGVADLAAGYEESGVER